MLDDQVPRVAAHTCAAITNFFEGTNEHIASANLEVFLNKLFLCIENGISILKENAVTAIAAVAEAADQHFVPFLGNTMAKLSELL